MRQDQEGRLRQTVQIAITLYLHTNRNILHPQEVAQHVKYKCSKSFDEEETVNRWVGRPAELLDEERHALLCRGLVSKAHLA